MRVRTKLIAGFAALVLLIWIISFFAGMNSGKLKGQFDAVEDVVLPGTIAMKDIENTANEAYDETMTYILNDDTMAKEAALAHLHHLEGIKTEYFMYGTIEPEEFETNSAIAMKIINFHHAINSLIDQKDQGVDQDTLLDADRISSMPALLALQQEVNERNIAPLVVDDFN